MSPARTPMNPPQLEGFEHVRLLGSGGYADVFLYEQQMPRREVAIKVLLAEALGDRGRQQFFDEANAMAAVSTHPYIVTVFHADVSPTGHPYLVMEYYPRANFSVRARTEQLPVAEVLRTGIQVASAVETAHRVGILHRDIKPANILTSAYNRPGLTDFGIATRSAGAQEAEGMSIPWSPPEVINGTDSGDATADVYSLAATVYTLLAGRSPYEVAGGSNRSLDLIGRIGVAPPPPTGRREVPESLERALRHAMSAVARDRPASALEFARGLQAVELEQGWAPTTIEVSEDPRDVKQRGVDPDEDGTRLRPPVVIDPSGASGPAPSAPRSTGTSVRGQPPVDATGTRSTADPAADHTMLRSAGHNSDGSGLIQGVGSRPVGLSGTPAPRPVRPMPSAEVKSPTRMSDDSDASSGVSPSQGVERKQSLKRNSVLIAAVVVGVVSLVVTFQMFGDSGGGTTRSSTTYTTTSLPPPSSSASPSDVAFSPDGAEVTWVYGDDLETTKFLVTSISTDEVAQTERGATRFPVSADVSCVEVVAVTDGRAASDAESACR